MKGVLAFSVCCITSRFLSLMLRNLSSPTPNCGHRSVMRKKGLLTLPIVVFLEIFQDSGFYSSLSSTTVISSSRYHGDEIATSPGLTVRTLERRKFYLGPFILVAWLITDLGLNLQW